MPPRRSRSNRQSYPREQNDLLAARSLFPSHSPPLSDREIISALEAAYRRAQRNRQGGLLPVPSTPKELVRVCIKHLRHRSDPILNPYFYSLCELDEVFELDAIPHEMQRQRMKVGVFYQFLAIELMRACSQSRNSNIEGVFDGSREGDVVADIRTPGFQPGVRIYASVKKSSDTVGGQDVPGVIRRLEDVAIADRNLTRPYLCVFCYATPPNGVIRSYEDSRHVRYNRDGNAYSDNCESWEPGFVFPFISGRPATEIYKLAITRVRNYLPFYTLAQRQECAKLLREQFRGMGLIGQDGKLDQVKFLEFIMSQPS